MEKFDNKLNKLLGKLEKQELMLKELSDKLDAVADKLHCDVQSERSTGQNWNYFPVNSEPPDRSDSY